VLGENNRYVSSERFDLTNKTSRNNENYLAILLTLEDFNSPFNIPKALSAYYIRTFTGVKLNKNRTQYSRLAIFGSLSKALSYTRRKVFGISEFYEKMGFIHFTQQTACNCINLNNIS